MLSYLSHYFYKKWAKYYSVLFINKSVSLIEIAMPSLVVAQEKQRNLGAIF